MDWSPCRYSWMGQLSFFCSSQRLTRGKDASKWRLQKRAEKLKRPSSESLHRVAASLICKLKSRLTHRTIFLFQQCQVFNKNYFIKFDAVSIHLIHLYAFCIHREFEISIIFITFRTLFGYKISDVSQFQFLSLWFLVFKLYLWLLLITY